MQHVIHGDCLEVMRTMDDKSIDFIVTDPPYGLKFMGKDWDHGVPGVEFWKEALRICKPGSMMAAFGGTRTYHRLACAIEDAGWEIRDCICWLYASGFPKSHNKFGFDGYGTALKPAYEPILLAMKPLDGTFALNAKKWGVAGINIDDCRIETSDILSFGSRQLGDGIKYGKCKPTTEGLQNKKGRWPANLILDEEAGRMLDQQTEKQLHLSGKSTRGDLSRSMFSGLKDADFGKRIDFEDASTGASRFFYCAKASSKERNAGLEGMPLKQSNPNFGSGGFSRPTDQPERKQIPCANHHPTVKPIALMKYILKLLAPPNDPIFLDPFAGSGTTLLAAKELGLRCIGIEKEEEYCEIARKRLP